MGNKYVYLSILQEVTLDETRHQKISSRFYWPEISRDVREYVASCDICQRTNDGGKFVKAAAPLHPIRVQPEVWRMVRRQEIAVKLLKFSGV